MDTTVLEQLAACIYCGYNIVCRCQKEMGQSLVSRIWLVERDPTNTMYIVCVANELYNELLSRRAVHWLQLTSENFVCESLN